MSPLYSDRYSGLRIGTAFSAHGFREFKCCLGDEGKLLRSSTKKLWQHVVCLIPPGFSRREESPHPIDTIWIGFAGEGFTCETRAALEIEDAELSAFIERIWLFAGARGLPIGSELDGRMKTMAVWFLRVPGNRVPSLHGNQSQRATAYSERNLRRNHTMETLASRFQRSEGHLNRLLKEESGGLLSPL